MQGNHPHEPGFSAGGRGAARAEPDGVREGGKRSRPIILATVARDARLDSKFLLLITLSAAIATLGLLQNSTAVVIGAMLISPLLGPILGIGFGLATIDSALLKRSIITIAAGMAAATLVSALLVLASPIRDVTSELTARTQPNLLDLGVAVIGGVAGVYAILRRLSGVMVGVAIATALVPPLSTIGFGIATLRWDFALGAALLFLTNGVAIALAATVIARLNRFGPSLTPQHTVLQLIGVLAALALLSVPLGLSLDRLVREARARTVVRTSLERLLSSGDRIDTVDVRMAERSVVIDGVVLVAAHDPALPAKLQRAVSARLDRPVDASVVQVKRERGENNPFVRGLAERIARLEAVNDESAQIVRALTADGLMTREALAIDPQSRIAYVTRNPAAESEAARASIDAALDRVIAEHGAWRVVQNVGRQPADEAADRP